MSNALKTLFIFWPCRHRPGLVCHRRTACWKSRCVQTELLGRNAFQATVARNPSWCAWKSLQKLGRGVQVCLINVLHILFQRHFYMNLRWLTRKGSTPANEHVSYAYILSLFHSLRSHTRSSQGGPGHVPADTLEEPPWSTLHRCQCLS